jgi:hypothetical protein
MAQREDISLLSAAIRHADACSTQTPSKDYQRQARRHEIRTAGRGLAGGISTFFVGFLLSPTHLLTIRGATIAITVSCGG